ncbi:hypothetical protein LIER_08349 [Lithospermum erythrorhizon]|uniref:Uncharacterized protein n=1 Tax=Lithospermum erythrorhizon TaxID=34254 RepID=A0AAV3PD88_LITER
MQFLTSSTENGWRVILGSVSSRAVPLNQIAPRSPTFLVLGSEGIGLRLLIERSCSQLVKIPGNTPPNITVGEDLKIKYPPPPQQILPEGSDEVVILRGAINVCGNVGVEHDSVHPVETANPEPPVANPIMPGIPVGALVQLNQPQTVVGAPPPIERNVELQGKMFERFMKRDLPKFSEAKSPIQGLEFIKDLESIFEPMGIEGPSWVSYRKACPRQRQVRRTFIPPRSVDLSPQASHEASRLWLQAASITRALADGLVTLYQVSNHPWDLVLLDQNLRRAQVERDAADRAARHPLASMPPLSSLRPPHARIVRADLHRCGSELSEKDMAKLRSRYYIPSSVMLIRPSTTDCAHTPPPGLRTFFVVAMDNGLRFPVHPFIGEEDKSSMPLYFHTDGHVLKAVGLFPIVVADPGALEVLRVSFCMLDHASLPPPAAPTATPN